MKTKRHRNAMPLLIIVCILVGLLLIYEIIHIYALFHSEVSGDVQLQNGVWTIVVNGTEISRGTEKRFVIDQINTEGNDHIKPGSLAPGLSGNFEILINPQNTDVSVKYDITLDQQQLTKENIKIKSIQEENGNTLVKTGENTYTGVILLQQIKSGATNKIKMEIEWQNEEIYDDEDTALGSKYNEKLQIPIKVKAQQYLGEEIIPYTESTENTETP